MANFRFYLDGQEVDEPVGWDNTKFNVIRSETHGIDQPFTTPVTFTGDLDRSPNLANGAQILRLKFESEFVNGSVDVQIVSDFKVDGQTWQFNGLIDFSSYEEINICDGCSDGVSVEIIEDDFRDNFRRRSDVEIDLLSTVDLDGNEIGGLDLDTIRLHCQQLYLVASARNLDQQSIQSNYDGAGWDLDDFGILLPLYYNNSDFKNPLGSTFDPTQNKYTTASPTFVNNTDFQRTIKFQISAEGRFKCFIGFYPGESANITFSIQVKNELDVETQRLYLYDSPINFWDNANNTDWSFSIEQDLVLDAGDRVYVFMQWGSAGTVKVGVTPTPNDSRSLLVTTTSACASLAEVNESALASACQGMYVQDFLRRIVAVMTGDGTRLKSDYFSVENAGCQWNNFITTGLFIRNAQTVQQLINGCNQVIDPGSQYAIKTTWKKAFDGLTKIFWLGWEFEPDGYNGWNIRVEPVEYFYQANVIAEFENVADIKRYPLKEKLFNSIAVGYTDRWKNIQVSGIFAIHTERNYFVNSKIMDSNSSGKVDYRSDIITEGYSIEANRRLQFLENDSGSSDRPNDYDLFLVWLNKEELTIDPIQGSGYAFPDESGPITFPAGSVSYASNLIGTNNSPVDRIYNVLHTPARVAARGWKWLGQNAFGLTGANYKLKYQSGQYFTTFQMAVPDPCGEITSSYFGEDFDIDDDSTGENFPGVLVQPIGYEITVPEELCDFLETANNGKKLIRFRCGSSNFVGFILRGENQPSGDNGGLSTYTLIGRLDPGENECGFSSGFSSGFC